MAGFPETCHKEIDRDCIVPRTRLDPVLKSGFRGIQRHQTAIQTAIQTASPAGGCLSTPVSPFMNRIPAVTIRVPSILVVDDQDANLQLVGGFLRREGYEVNTANSGPAALECIAARRPDLILLDVRMPGMDGFALCERVRLIPECLDIPVIFLSAAEESGFIIKAFESGGVDYITKPISPAIVLALPRRASQN